ncbi:hypothetical protein KR044_007495 [Drosophila immigrans]|nr:hypothetical protein KR044_007495 [Drosophila immigrans]
MMMLKPYQLAIAIAIFLACLSPEVSSFARNFNHGRPNATNYAPAQTYPGQNYNHTRPNIGFQQNYHPQPAYNSGPAYGNRPGNYSVGGVYRPRNSTNVFARLFKFW